MSSPPQANGIHDGDETDTQGPHPRVPRPNPAALKHQVREVNALVDRAMENLEQVMRALRYIERDL